MKKYILRCLLALALVGAALLPTSIAFASSPPEGYWTYLDWYPGVYYAEIYSYHGSSNTFVRYDTVTPASDLIDFDQASSLYYNYYTEANGWHLMY